ncbi:hypothetical protein SH501x_004654 [Pirellulaceae bacterium SH501]
MTKTAAARVAFVKEQSYRILSSYPIQNMPLAGFCQFNSQLRYHYIRRVFLVIIGPSTLDKFSRVAVRA